jgi:hypothetical protein
MRGEVTFYILIRVGLVFLRVAASSNKRLQIDAAAPRDWGETLGNIYE